jgi:surface antigen
MLQILNWKTGKLRKYNRFGTFYFVSLLSRSESRRTSFQGRFVSFIQQHKALSFVTSLSILVLLVNFVLAPVHSSIILVEESQILSQQTCANCSSSNISSSTKSGDTFQEPFAFPPGLALTRHSPVITSIQSGVPESILTMSTQTLLPAQGTLNLFPYGSCTWWANQRYFQLHGIYVPWRTQSNAWQWTDRAEEFGWEVSSSPIVGAIIDLQPGVQRASWAGHVAIVERILSNGNVIASNMNWGAFPWQVILVEFTPGPGVTFLYLLNSKFLFGSSSNRIAAQNF